MTDQGMIGTTYYNVYVKKSEYEARLPPSRLAPATLCLVLHVEACTNG